MREKRVDSRRSSQLLPHPSALGKAFVERPLSVTSRHLSPTRGEASGARPAHSAGEMLLAERRGPPQFLPVLGPGAGGPGLPAGELFVGVDDDLGVFIDVLHHIAHLGLLNGHAAAGEYGSSFQFSVFSFQPWCPLRGRRL